MKAGIFVVEDEAAFFEIYNAVFSLLGLELVGWAYSGEEGIDKFKQLDACPALVIMDHRLPGKNGIETMLEMSRIWPDVKTLFVSADGSVRGDALCHGALDFIQKPFELRDFMVAIKKSIPGFSTKIDGEKANVRKLKSDHVIEST